MLQTLALLVCVVALPPASNPRPIIGVVSQPNDGEGPGVLTYVPAAYVKFLESAGARVLPVPYDAPESELQTLLASLNGLLFTGGGLSLAPETPFFKAASFMWKYAMQANDKGDYFPIWGTCQGFQLESALVLGNNSLVQDGFDSENLPLALNLTEGWQTSRLLGGAPDGVMNTLTKVNSTINLHHEGVTPASWRAHLSSFFKVLSTNQDRKGREFISMWEAINYPFYGVQFHPERSLFEWDIQELLVHSKAVVETVQYMANFFVDEARRSAHKFADPQVEESLLIYQFPVTYTGNDTTQDFPDRQTYFFQPASQ